MHTNTKNTEINELNLADTKLVNALRVAGPSRNDSINELLYWSATFYVEQMFNDFNRKPLILIHLDSLLKYRPSDLLLLEMKKQILSVIDKRYERSPSFFHDMTKSEGHISIRAWVNGVIWKTA